MRRRHTPAVAVVRPFLFAAAVALAAAVVFSGGVAYGNEDDAVNGCHEDGYQDDDCHPSNEEEIVIVVVQDTSGCEWTEPVSGPYEGTKTKNWTPTRAGTGHGGLWTPPLPWTQRPRP